MSVDRDLDIDAEYVLVQPRCGLHDVPLVIIGGDPKLTRDMDHDTGEVWWDVDLSEFGCPEFRLIITDEQIEADNNSWYLKLQIMTVAS